MEVQHFIKGELNSLCTIQYLYYNKFYKKILTSNQENHGLWLQAEAHHSSGFGL